MTRLIVTTEDELRRLIREELAAQKVTVTVSPSLSFDPYIGNRKPDGMGGSVPDDLGGAIDAALGLAGVRRTETAPTPETMQPTPRSAAPVLPDQQSADRSPPTPSDAGQG